MGKLINNKLIGIILILLPIETFILALASEMYLVAYLPIIIGYILYMHKFKELLLSEKIISIISMIFMAISLLSFGNLESLNGGIDAVGEALVLALGFRASRIIAKLLVVILLLIDKAEFLFNKKVLLAILGIIAVVVISIFGFRGVRIMTTTIKVDESVLPTVADFEKELISRELLTNESNYKLYGVKHDVEKGISLDFKDNGKDKYPMYIYISDCEYEEEQPIIYYINGEIYAIKGDYYVGETFEVEEKVIFDYPRTLMSEKENITTYDIKNDRFVTGKYVTYTGYNYYAQNTNDISVFLDIPEVVYEENEILNFNIEYVEKIDKEALRYW